MAEAEKLPEIVYHFILQSIDSVAELEGLLLARADVAVAWDAASLAGRLYIDERAAAVVLAALHRRGLLSNDNEVFRYQPASDALRESVDALAMSYPRFLIPLTNLIHSKPNLALRELRLRMNEVRNRYQKVWIRRGERIHQLTQRLRSWLVPKRLSLSRQETATVQRLQYLGRGALVDIETLGEPRCVPI